MAYPSERHVALPQQGRIRHRTTLLALTVGMFLLPSDALAYIDPGTGSLIYQTLLAVLLGAGVVFRRVWFRFGRALFGVVGRGSKRKPSDRADAP